ncbi:hypothetical protein BS50DRAFT_635805 [Corynespora cassiicola Philippines]|uniref:Uncharacterized protein n=1 Tax=Corynespora cassiicola Philippines TaxID=1448308 RepID=A0A2T2NHR0_CORCC|nr:hypothetical protein BS50DRAFT_635805 [Corynespora cassiicola Philippines]
MKTSGEKFELKHALARILLGRHCRACGEFFQLPSQCKPDYISSSKDRWVEVPTFCHHCNPTADTEEAELIRISIYLQDRWIAKMREQNELIPFTSPIGMTAEQRWWWRAVSYTQITCRLSLLQLSDMVRSFFNSPSNTHNAVEFAEFEFTPSAYYKYKHCAFALTMQSGSQWIFDPTGVQFGVEGWPVISRRHWYFSPDKHRQVQVWRRLGDYKSCCRGQLAGPWNPLDESDSEEEP